VANKRLYNYWQHFSTAAIIFKHFKLSFSCPHDPFYNTVTCMARGLVAFTQDASINERFYALRSNLKVKRYWQMQCSYFVRRYKEYNWIKGVVFLDILGWLAKNPWRFMTWIFHHRITRYNLLWTLSMRRHIVWTQAIWSVFQKGNTLYAKIGTHCVHVVSL
jgi:hypothetical protein